MTTAPLPSIPSERLREVAERLRRGEPLPDPLTVREFLAWFGAQRRGIWIVDSIRKALGRAGLETNPDFEAAYIDSPMTFQLAKAPAVPASHQEESRDQVLPDPTYRIGKLASANRKPLSVSPDDTVTKAVTLMLANDYSQLPVMTSDRDVKGKVMRPKFET